MSDKPADSQMNTVSVPPIGSDPAILYAATSRVLRVVIVNIGGAPVLLAHDSTSLQQVGNTAGTYQLAPGKDVTIVLMPQQRVLAGATGANGLVSFAVSEAIPIAWGES